MSPRKPDYMGGCQRICKSSEVRLRARSTKETRRLMGSASDYKKNRRYEKVAGRWRRTKRRCRGEREQKPEMVLLKLLVS